MAYILKKYTHKHGGDSTGGISRDQSRIQRLDSSETSGIIGRALIIPSAAILYGLSVTDKGIKLTSADAAYRPGSSISHRGNRNPAAKPHITGHRPR
jgi:hypothetical protein